MRKLLLSVFLVLICVLLPQWNPAEAAVETVVAEGRHVMGDQDTRDSAKKHAVKDAMRMAVEKAGVYVSSYSKTENLTLTKDEIETVASNIIKVEEEEVSYDTKDKEWVCIVKLTAKVDTSNLTPERIMELKMTKFLDKYEEKYLNEKVSVEKEKLETERKRLETQRQQLEEEQRRIFMESSRGKGASDALSGEKTNSTRRQQAQPPRPTINQMQEGYTGIIFDASAAKFRGRAFPYIDKKGDRILGTDGSVVLDENTLSEEQWERRKWASELIVLPINSLNTWPRRSGNNPLIVNVVDFFRDPTTLCTTMYVSGTDAQKIRDLEAVKHFVRGYNMDVVKPRR